jgi:ABC-2 type transport system ATP-binding protein
MTAPLASLDRVTRTFGALTALDEVTLDIHPGVILGLLGPNGAGKSTLISLLQGLRRPTSGTVRLFGDDPQRPAARERLGSTPQETALPPTLRVQETIDFVGAHFADRVPTAQLAEDFGLTELLRRQNGSLSGGQKRRLAVALAFVGRPKLVLLDEPTTGLDASVAAGVLDLLRGLLVERDVAAVVVSHDFAVIEALTERAVVMQLGRVVERGLTDQLFADPHHPYTQRLVAAARR